jgi:hypothetical protein
VNSGDVKAFFEQVSARPGGTIAVTDAVEYPCDWMCTGHAGIWLGFTPEQVEGCFQQGGLAGYGYSSLGMQ